MNLLTNVQKAGGGKNQEKISTGIDLRAAYAILVKAYFRNHPDALETTMPKEEQNRD
jgi:hypothetical protein